MSIRPLPSPKSSPSKTGRGQLRADDPRLLQIATAAKNHGCKPAARLLGISPTLVRRAMKLHNIPSRPLGWHLRHDYAP